MLVSFDVSHFTNVFLKETIQIMAHKIYQFKDKPTKTFMRLMEAVTSGVLKYQWKYYQQADGVTMGSPLGPKMANVCLANFEEKLLVNNDESPCSLRR